jgi:hypothetical protein
LDNWKQSKGGGSFSYMLSESRPSEIRPKLPVGKAPHVSRSGRLDRRLKADLPGDRCQTWMRYLLTFLMLPVNRRSCDSRS